MSTVANAQQATIAVDAKQLLHKVSPFLTGSCIEDVNHEIYGGIYSQMIFGESFQEPAPSIPPKGFRALGGIWKIEKGVLSGSKGNGNMIVSDLPAFEDGEVSVEISFQDRDAGCAGLILRLGNANLGIDTFDGYEVSLDGQLNVVRLGRHRQDWTHFKDVPCEFKFDDWTKLRAKLVGSQIEVSVNDKIVATIEDTDARSIRSGTVGLRQWQRSARYRNLTWKSNTVTQQIPFEPQEMEQPLEVSGMWRPILKGNVQGSCELIETEPFVGQQSQQLAFKEGTGSIGIENRSLNRWGMHFEANQPYEGVLWAKATKASKLSLSIENATGSEILDEKTVDLSNSNWQRIEFSFVSKSTETNGRFAIRLKQPGQVLLGYVSLQSGPWGRFKNLPVRKDVAEKLIEQGVTILRYGGSMINHPQYRWKNMIGPRDRRQPYQGFWYPHSTNGWGIIDFMDFCEAAGFEYVPAFNMAESPQDMLDFLEYAKGDSSTTWGKKRMEAGHPEPYKLNLIELGNEERVDEAYAVKFEAIATAIWKADEKITLVVGDFVYSHPINDPYKVTGSAANLADLKGQERILEFASKSNREVWFDVHVGTDGPRPDSSFDSMFSFRDALTKISHGAKFKVVTFEFNSSSHSQKRALANALAINAIERDGQIPIATAANALQPDGQNDNGWNQGLLFLNPSKVWLQPTGYVTQIYANHHQPFLVKCDVQTLERTIDCNAKISADRSTLTLFIVNPTTQTVESKITLQGFQPVEKSASITEMAGSLDAANTAQNPEQIKPVQKSWTHQFDSGSSTYSVPPFSVSSITLK